MADFRMPDIGEGLTEGDIVTWHVNEGDTVAINDLLVEVETAQAIVELPSPYAGIIQKIYFSEGRTVEVGAVIVSVGDAAVGPLPVHDTGSAGSTSVHESPATSAQPPQPPQPPQAEDDGERVSVLVGYGPTRAKVARRPRRKQPERLTIASSRHDNPNQRPYATPPVRKMARDMGVDLRDAPASGARGQITRDDLRNLAPQASAGESPRTGVAPAQTRIPVKGVRKFTAEAMVASAFTAPHVTEWVTVDVTKTMKLLDRLRSDKAFADVRLSPLVMVMRATLAALGRYPEVNARWDSATGEIVQFHNVNLGIAAATPRGLLVPNIRAAQSLNTVQLAHALTDLVSEARAGKTQPERMRDGTFTITNIGVFGVDGGTPILNPGEAAILCMGQIRRQPWEHKGKVRLRSTTTLALSFDHRLVDGELGSKVLSDIARVLQNPGLALAG